MNAIKVDTGHRVRLPILQPGDYYVPHFKDAERIELRRVQPPKPKRKMTTAQALRAIDQSPVVLPGGYDALRAETREP